jgi:hypothetical protein
LLIYIDICLYLYILTYINIIYIYIFKYWYINIGTWIFKCQIRLPIFCHPVLHPEFGVYSTHHEPGNNFCKKNIYLSYQHKQHLTRHFDTFFIYTMYIYNIYKVIFKVSKSNINVFGSVISPLGRPITHHNQKNYRLLPYIYIHTLNITTVFTPKYIKIGFRYIEFNFITYKHI